MDEENKINRVRINHAIDDLTQIIQNILEREPKQRKDDEVKTAIKKVIGELKSVNLDKLDEITALYVNLKKAIGEYEKHIT